VTLCLYLFMCRAFLSLFLVVYFGAAEQVCGYCFSLMCIFFRVFLIFDGSLVIGCHVLKGFDVKLLHLFVYVIDLFVKGLEHPICSLL